MKKFFILVPALLLGMVVMAQPPKGKSKKGTVYGANVDKSGAMPANDLTGFMKGKASANVKVQGKVTEVCQAMGCWIKLETADGPVMVKMKDHAFYVPMALSGKNVVIEGEASVKETSVDMLKHYAEDAGKSKEEIDAIKESQKQMMIMAAGIVVL
ncbi:MAG TPA: DUF4920 domain-containing protein [Chitinophagaceae bacterium]|nr:DUF4920 domain-containing protein [Chitinophagaceae bacterium]